jgi:hypothetical protein
MAQNAENGSECPNRFFHLERTSEKNSLQKYLSKKKAFRRKMKYIVRKKICWTKKFPL